MEAVDDVDILISQETAVPESVPPTGTSKRKGHNTRALPKVKVDEVAKLSSEGKSCKEIADTLKIGKSTASLLLRKQKSKPVVEPKPAMNSAIADTFANSISITPALPSKNDLREEAKLDAFLNDFMKEDKPVAKKGRAKKVNFDEFLAPAPREVAVAKEPEMDKSMLVTKININVENFPEILADYIKPSKEEYLAKVAKMGMAELKSTLGLLETTRISTNMANQMKHLLFGAAAGIEFGTKNLLKMKTEGYADTIRRQEMEIQSCLREIALNNIDTYKAAGLEKPQTRLATIMVMSLLSLDAKNRVAAMSARQANQFVEPAKEQKYSDL
jgi:hypothetical protein